MDELLEYIDAHWGQVSQCKTCDGQIVGVCGQCNTSVYCGIECQRQDWIVHQFDCIGGNGKPEQELDLSNLPPEILNKITTFLRGNDLKQFNLASREIETTIRFAFFKHFYVKLNKEMFTNPTFKEIFRYITNVIETGPGAGKLSKQLTEYQNDRTLKNVVIRNKLIDWSTLFSLIHISELYLSNNQIIELPREIGKLTLLLKLDLKYNNITQLPQEIGKLVLLRELHLNNNRIIQIPQEIGKLTLLRELHLANNQLVQIPHDIGKLASLRKLNLSNNQIGQIPHEIGNLTLLQELYLNNNRLIQISREIGNLTSLGTLYLSNNQIIQVPREIGNLVSLQILHLEYNQITQLPHEIGNLNLLQALYLDNNQVTQLPREINKLASLQILTLKGNLHFENLEWLKRPRLYIIQ